MPVMAARHASIEQVKWGNRACHQNNGGRPGKINMTIKSLHKKQQTRDEAVASSAPTTPDSDNIQPDKQASTRLGKLSLYRQPEPLAQGEAQAAPVESEKKARKKNRKAAVGSQRGIETMFRTAYRSQLDLTALAATKANIMISLNGLILSVLTLSGPFVLVAEPMFTAPIAVFLFTCLCSIIFAVLAAKPSMGKANNSVADFNSDNANILVFEHFASLSIDEHSRVMSRMLRNNKRIYKNMSRQLYLLGIEAHRKYRLLKFSYIAFLIGLTVSTLMLMGVGLIYQTSGFDEIMTALQSRGTGLQASQ
jgi:hypothetical protein